MMMQAHAPKRALQLLPGARRFSTSASVAAASPYRKASQVPTKPAQKNVIETAKRDQSTAAATSPQRAVPSPAFNRTDTNKFKDVQPLSPFRQPEMDHSFVGMKGGEIFHEMMLRQGVKHVCEY